MLRDPLTGRRGAYTKRLATGRVLRRSDYLGELSREDAEATKNLQSMLRPIMTPMEPQRPGSAPSGLLAQQVIQGTRSHINSACRTGMPSYRQFCTQVKRLSMLPGTWQDSFASTTTSFASGFASGYDTRSSFGELRHDCGCREVPQFFSLSRALRGSSR